MSIASRLTEVFQEARRHPIPFNDTARFIFFSDVHRSDGSWADDFARNQVLYTFALTYYYARGYTYFELGDGDELFNNRLFSDIRQIHDHVFRLIKKFHDAQPTRLYLLYGNHDKERADPEVVSKTLRAGYFDLQAGHEVTLFKDIQVHEGLVLEHTPSRGQLFLVHGHQGDLFNDRFWRVNRFLTRVFWSPLESLGITEPTSPAKNTYKRRNIEGGFKAWIKAENQPVVCGHTHKPRFALEGEIPYFNTGSCVAPHHITGIEIQRGMMVPIKWWLVPDKTGRLRVTREEMERPRTIRSLFQCICTLRSTSSCKTPDSACRRNIRVSTEAGA